jgi:hypothetical protein
MVLMVSGICAGADLKLAAGKLVFLRINDSGGYGPPDDFLDAEVIVALDSMQGYACGFQLRSDANRPVREGMLSLLRQAFADNTKVELQYLVTPPKKNGVIIRVVLLKP